MTPQKKLKQIKLNSGCDYCVDRFDREWLIARVEQLEEVLDRVLVVDDLPSRTHEIIDEALSTGPKPDEA